MEKYTLKALIGSGGFGRVFEARRTSDGLPCAMKFMQEDSTEEDRARFAREVRIQLPLKHPNIVPIIGHDVGGSSPWFVMPRARESLRQRLEVGGHGPELLWIVEHAAEGLVHAHANGIIHRDLKPENILIFDGQEDTEYAAISDFGLGRLVNRDTVTLTVTNAWMGTVVYASPEQFKDAKNVDYRSDIYSLGKVLAEVLTGDLPYPTIDIDKVPQEYQYIVSRACAHDPAKRYQTVEEFLKDLRSLQSKDPAYARPSDEVKTLVAKIGSSPATGNEDLRALARVLARNVDDTEVLMNMLPLFDPVLLKKLLKAEPEVMRHTIAAYDKLVSGIVPWSYCDRVADFYESLFKVTDDTSIKVLVLNRLPRIGQLHDRYYVGDVFAQMVTGLSDPSLIMAVRDTLNSEPEVASWIARYLKDKSIPPALRNIFKEPST